MGRSDDRLKELAITLPWPAVQWRRRLLMSYRSPQSQTRCRARFHGEMPKTDCQLSSMAGQVTVPHRPPPKKEAIKPDRSFAT